MNMYTKHTWTKEHFFNFNYVKYLPAGYDKTKKYPIIFFLHGAGERGNDLELAMSNGYMKYVKEQGKKYPFIFIAPQCPEEKYWGCFTESLLAFFDDMINALPVDEDRVYLTGLSMGGTGTWMLSMACPEKFAAIAPVCGTGIYWNAERLIQMPIYIYHGDCDEIVPINESVNMVSAINRRGGSAKLEICHGRGHDVWVEAYGNDDLWKWLLEHRRSSKE